MNNSDMLAIGSNPNQLAAIDWHHTIGRLIQSLGEPRFWERLTQSLGTCVPVDNWVAMHFEDGGAPVVLGICDEADADALMRFETYLQTAYLIDPFYLALRDLESIRHTPMLTLAEIAPDQFTTTDYYQTYFCLNVMADEVQFILPGENGGWISLSLGSRRTYSPADLGTLRLVAPWVTALIGKHVAHQPPSIRSEKASEQRMKPAFPALLGSTLTAREQEVMYLLLSGHSSKLIGRKLGISDETVKVHRRHIYAKFNVSTHSQLFSIFLAQNEASPR